MAGPWKLTLDVAGIGAILTSGDVAAMVNGAAHEIAAGVKVPDSRGRVEVEPYTTDRAAAAVVLVHPDAMGLQAKYGLLTRAAGGQGIEVRGR